MKSVHFIVVLNLIHKCIEFELGSPKSFLIFRGYVQRVYSGHITLLRLELKARVSSGSRVKGYRANLL